MPRKNGGSDAPVIEPNNHRPSRKEYGESPRYQSDTCSFDGVDNAVLRNAIVAVTDAGAAIQLGRTSDGGALTIYVYDGDRRIREWPHEAEKAEGVLKWLTDMYSVD